MDICNRYPRKFRKRSVLGKIANVDESMEDFQSLERLKWMKTELLNK